MRRLLAVLAGVALGLLLLVWLGDEPARRYVEGRVAADLEASVPFSGAAEVDLGGSPFLLHALTGEFPTVSIRAPGMEVAAQAPSGQAVTVRLADVALDLEAVRTASGSATADRVTGRALLPWAELSAASGLTAADAGGGRLALTGSAEVLGQTVSGTLTGVPVVTADGASVTVSDAEVRLAGVALPPALTDLALERFAAPVPIPLPYGLTLAAVESTAPGVALEVGGRTVTFPLEP